MLEKLAEYLGREVEIWTQENVEPWVGLLKEVDERLITVEIDELLTYILTDKVVAFRLSEDEQEEK